MSAPMFMGLSPGFWLVLILSVIVLVALGRHERRLRREQLRKIERMADQETDFQSNGRRGSTRRPHH